MKTRITALIFSIVMLAVLLTGCTCEHEWAEATCLTPKTCNLCQETEGEALGHSWTDATCAAPKTCTVCGETEGELLSNHTWEEATCAAPKTCEICGKTEGEMLTHIWKEANYQEPKTCTECGVTEGEPLLADFEKYGLKTMKPEKGKTYDYVTACSENAKKKTVGKLKIVDYITIPEMKSSEKNSPYNLPYKEGYVWKFISCDIEFSDENAWKYGYSYIWCYENYYAIEEWNNSLVEISDGIEEFTVSYNGNNESVIFKRIRNYKSGWYNKKNHFYLDVAFQVPEGYDGIVFGFCDATIKWADDTQIYDVADENTLLFRLD